MRMRLDECRRDEGGAVLIIVALTMIVLLAFTALVVDVGGLLVTRRRMVRASDSAALAAAQSCATTTLSDAQTEADEYASANQTPEKAGSVTRAEFTEVGCGTAKSGSVTVEYRVDQHTFFTAILGLPDDYSVPARATAIWGQAGIGNPLPIMVSEAWYDFACPLEDQPVGTTITCLWDDDTENTNAFWGGLDLDEWDVPADYDCGHELDDPGPDEAAQQKEEVQQGGIDEDLAIKEPPDPTWVCVTNGVRNDVVIELDKYAKANPDNVLFFPITRPPHLLEDNGKVEKVNVVGFIKVRVVEAHQPQALEPITQNCIGHYSSPVSKDEVLSLDSFTIQNTTDCNSYSAPFTSVKLQQVKELKNGAPSGGNLMSSIDPRNGELNVLTRTFTYKANKTLAGMYAQFQFTKPAALDDCGGHTPTNSSAWCITFEWLGNQFTHGGTIECPVDEICPGNVISIRLDE